jgi:hypothetical protein
LDRAHVAQLVEHILGKDEVISSILIMGSSLRAELKAEREDCRAKVKRRRAEREMKSPRYGSASQLEYRSKNEVVTKRQTTRR